jgi:aerobic C4-dicarboxylate transport protein
MRQAAVAPKRAPRFYNHLYVQVLLGIALAVAVGYAAPKFAVDMKPLGDGFIKLIKMVIGFVVFFTVVSGMAEMSDLKKVGRIGGKALLYFEVVSTMALGVGLLVGHILQPGGGFNANPATLDAKAIAQYAGKAQEQTIADFLLNIIPNTVVEAFARGDILPIVFVSLLVGYVMSRMGERAAPLRAIFDAGSNLVFGIMNVLMRLAPIGAFGAMAFTVGRYGLASLGSLAKLVGAYYLTSAIFVVVVLGLICRAAGFSVFRFLAYIKDEILIVLATSSSDPVLPALMEKLERLGCRKSTVGIVVPTGYIFNTDGTSIYMTMAALFVAQATNTDMTVTQEITLFAVAMLTSKGASGVTGAGFIALVATLSVVPTIPVAGMALILGIDRFMSELRALINCIGNGVATLVISRWEGELQPAALQMALRGDPTTAEAYPLDGTQGEPAPATMPQA